VSSLSAVLSLRRATAPMYNAMCQDSDIGILEGRDHLTAFDAARKEAVDRPRDRLEDRIVVASGERHWAFSVGGRAKAQKIRG
jgi:hypothetical protein